MGREYKEVPQDEPDYSYDPFYGMSSAVAFAREENEKESDRMRRRRPKNLSIDTGLASRGLGVAVPGKEVEHKMPRKRHSYDEEALRVREKSPVSTLSILYFCQISSKVLSDMDLAGNCRAILYKTGLGHYQ